MRFAQTRASVLAHDVANARTPGFAPEDVRQEPDPAGGVPFAAVLTQASASGPSGVLEYAMGAQAKNAVTYRALADQERAMLKEVRTVAEEARR